MKLFSCALLVASSLVAATCLGAAPAPDCVTPRVTLTVGTQFGIPPYESLNAAGQPVGFDVAIACELRKRLGFANIQFRNINPLDATALNNGTVTITISALNQINTTTLANEALVAYADFAYALSFLNTPPAGLTPANALTTLVGNGTRFGVINNSFQASVLAALGARVTPFATVAQALAALKAGTIDTFFSSNVVANTAQSNDATIVPLDNVILPVATNPALAPFVSTNLGIAVSSSGTVAGTTTCCQLYVDIRQAIADMVADGTYAALAKANGVPTTFTGPTVDLTPAACASTTPNLVQRNALANFLFNRFCPCQPTVVPTPTVLPV